MEPINELRKKQTQLYLLAQHCCTALLSVRFVPALKSEGLAAWCATNGAADGCADTQGQNAQGKLVFSPVNL